MPRIRKPASPRRSCCGEPCTHPACNTSISLRGVLEVQTTSLPSGFFGYTRTEMRQAMLDYQWIDPDTAATRTRRCDWRQSIELAQFAADSGFRWDRASRLFVPV